MAWYGKLTQCRCWWLATSETHCATVCSSLWGTEEPFDLFDSCARYKFSSFIHSFIKL